MYRSRTRWVGGVLVVGLLLTPSLVGRAEQDSDAPLVDAMKKRLQPEQAADGGRVFGDSSKPGMYVTRAKFEAGRFSRPHYHSQERWVTVIKGTWWTGEGDVFDEDNMIPIKEGGLMYHPAGFHHYDGAKDEDVIVQIMGMGPVETTRTEVDANGQPVNR